MPSPSALRVFPIFLRGSFCGSQSKSCASYCHEWSLSTDPERKKNNAQTKAASYLWHSLFPYVTGNRIVNDLIIHMNKFLDSDWLKEMHFSGCTTQKQGNSVKEKKKGNSVQITTISEASTKKLQDMPTIRYCEDRRSLPDAFQRQLKIFRRLPMISELVQRLPKTLLLLLWQ